MYSKRCINIRSVVAKQKDIIERMTFSEKGCFKSKKYNIVEDIPMITDEIWKIIMEHSVGIVQFINMLRNRFILIYTIHAIIRGENHLNSKMQDLSFFQLSSREPTPLQIMIIQSKTRKSNRGNNVLERVCRHKNPDLYCISALALYFFPLL